MTLLSLAEEHDGKIPRAVRTLQGHRPIAWRNHGSDDGCGNQVRPRNLRPHVRPQCLYGHLEANKRQGVPVPPKSQIPCALAPHVASVSALPPHAIHESAERASYSGCKLRTEC